MTEPVTTYTQRFVRGLWSLDRDLAYARHYPAVSWSGSFARDAAAVAGWQAQAGDAGWARRRSDLSALLAEADRLSALAELMGVAALPPGERATILGGRLVREGVLQQSALSPVDGFCDPARAAALGEAVLAVAARCRALADAGVDPATLESQDFSPILRAREEAGTADAVAARGREMLAALARLGGHGGALPSAAVTAADEDSSGEDRDGGAA